MMNCEAEKVRKKKIILVVGVVILVILLAGSVQAKTITATVTEKCRPSPGTFSVPAGQIATNFVLQDLKAGTKCGTGMFKDDYGWTIYGVNANGPIVYSLSNNVDQSGTRRKSEPYGPLNTLSLGPGTYMAYVDGGKLAYVKVNYELISVNIPSTVGSGEVDPPCSNDAFLLEPMPMTSATEYTAGSVLEAGTYTIWSGKQNSDGSIAWKATGPVQLKAKTSYVFDAANRVIGEFNPLNVETYASDAVVTLKCVHDNHYSICFEKIQSAVRPGEEWPKSAGGNGHYYEAVLVPGGITWNDANTRANAAGGHLATITSAAENQFVYNLVAEYDDYWLGDNHGNGAGPWLGGYQPAGSLEPAGGWAWVTGEPFSYTNWHTGEPNNGGGFGWFEENLLFYGYQTLKSPDWNDASRDLITKSYIAEYEV
ncbi:MAG: hypothetical protein M0Q13_06995 [Methanothrix sp.]|jgi:hypothetical protein|nr:hypothetical protein [Methanothrix sp.]